MDGVSKASAVGSMETLGLSEVRLLGLALILGETDGRAEGCWVFIGSELGCLEGIPPELNLIDGIIDGCRLTDWRTLGIELLGWFNMLGLSEGLREGVEGILLKLGLCEGSDE